MGCLQKIRQFTEDRSMTDSILAFPAREEDRLRLALRNLVAALEAQGEAVATLRGELSELAGNLQGLDTSFSAYRAELGSAAALLEAAGDEARQLERSAADWLSATRV
jgi:DNA-binding transcriptional regulator PaaX